MYIFLHRPKIDTLYSETCDRVEEQVKKTKGKATKGALKGILKLGTLLKHLLVDPEIDAELMHEYANSKEVIERLEPVQKLKIGLAWLQKDNLVMDLNDDNNELLEEFVGSYITVNSKFKVSGPFKREEIDLAEFEGLVRGTKLHFTAPGKQFVAWQMIYEWIKHEGLNFRVFGILSIIEAESGILVDPIAIEYYTKKPVSRRSDPTDEK